MRGSARFWKAAVLVLLPGTGACSHAIRLPPELDTAEQLTVEAPGGLISAREIRFGGYEAVEIQRSWTRGRGMSVGVGRGAGSRGDAHATYAFRFRATGEGEGEHVECEAMATRQALGVGSVDVETAATFGVSCTGGGVDGWRLTLQAIRNAQPKGVLRTPGRAYQVQGVGSGGGLVAASTQGFEIRQDDRAIAAIQKRSPASVWFADELAEADRATVASAAAALLILQRIQPE